MAKSTGKASIAVRKKKALSTPDNTREPNIEWVKNTDWTWSIITYLTDHLSFHIKLFSDSTADATKDGRPRTVAKDGKQQQYGVLAEHVFRDDPNHKKSYAAKPSRFVTSVETRLRRLKKEYQVHLKALGQTGAGIDPEEVQDDTPLSNLVDTILEKWPWWREFHAFWRELPNYNPIAVENSAPGADHAQSAASAFDRDVSDDDSIHEKSDVEDSEPKGKNDTDDDEASVLNDSDAQKEEDELEASESEDAPKLPKKRPSNGMVQPAPKISKTSHVGGHDAGLAKARANAKSGKTSRKQQTAAEKFNDFRSEESLRLARKREMDHELAMMNAKNKYMKYEFKKREAESNQVTHLEELRLQLQLAQTMQRPDAVSSHVSSTPLPVARDSMAQTPIHTPINQPLFKPSMSFKPSTTFHSQPSYSAMPKSYEPRPLGPSSSTFNVHAQSAHIQPDESTPTRFNGQLPTPGIFPSITTMASSDDFFLGPDGLTESYSGADNMYEDVTHSTDGGLDSIY